ncbi:hypothetical protein AB8Z38_20990 [Bradyrhizobium sp. LLZ17]|uniref:Uncharacterized protein n=1 Tax=Bradyrhizobium sp. LLZ17 TaxID=3239388 RepID=A0AB39XE48_9BRAD
MAHPFVRPGTIKTEMSPTGNPKSYRQEFLKTILFFLNVMPECRLDAQRCATPRSDMRSMPGYCHLDTRQTVDLKIAPRPKSTRIHQLRAAHALSAASTRDYVALP